MTLLRRSFFILLASISGASGVVIFLCMIFYPYALVAGPLVLRDLSALPVSGFVDHRGQFAFHKLNPVSHGSRFSEGLLYDWNRFLDKNGRTAFELKAVSAQPFSEGLAVVQDHNRWGFIDRSGRTVIGLTFAEARSFREGLAPVKVESLWGFVDKRGEIVIPPRFDDCAWFSEGKAAVAKDGKVGFINRAGQIVINPIYDAALGFKEGIATVRAINADDGAWHDVCINSAGKEVFDLTAIQVQNGGKVKTTKTESCALTDSSEWLAGRRRLPYALPEELPYRSNREQFSNGRLLFRGGEKYGYLDKRGNVAISCCLNDAAAFSEGLAAVTINPSGIPKGIVPPAGRLYGYINPAGEFLILPRYTSAADFHEGLARVREGNSGDKFIDKTGKVVFEAPSGEAGDFNDGLAPVGPMQFGVIHTKFGCIERMHPKISLFCVYCVKKQPSFFDKCKNAPKLGVFLCV
jgi:hypothetical protein